MESRWPEVHASLIVYARNQINAQLPDELQANIERGVSVLGVSDGSPRYFRSDVDVRENDFNLQDRPDANPDSGGTAVLAPPVTVAKSLRMRVVHRPLRHVEIVGPGGRIITAIEFLSPWNKRGKEARSQYGAKQLTYRDAGVHLVEIDLTRHGGYILTAPVTDIPESHQTPYAACVVRVDGTDEIDYFAIPLDEPLPNLPVPLRLGEPDAVLQLQELIDACYRDGRYWRTDYTADPGVPFDKPQSIRINEILTAAGRRG